MRTWSAGSLLGGATLLFIGGAGLKPVSAGLYLGEVAALETPVLTAGLGLLHFGGRQFAHIGVFVHVAVDFAAHMVPLFAVGATNPVFTINVVTLGVNLETVVAVLVVLEVLAALAAENDCVPAGQLHFPGVKHHLHLFQTCFVHGRAEFVEALRNRVLGGILIFGTVRMPVML